MNPIQNVLAFVDAFEHPTSYSDTMTLANGYFAQMYKDTWQTAFEQKDIQFVKFYERMALTDREKDLLYVATFFHAAFTTLHVTILTLGETPSPASVSELTKTFDAMTRLGAADILLNDKITLTKFIKLLQEISHDN